jgi:KaiC/GvpD/RAD55 family RecA-like ATPase
MPRVSSAPEDAHSPFHDVAQKIAKYVEQDSGEIDSIYCEQNNKGLLFAVQGDRERRYLFRDLDGASNASPESCGEGGGLYSFDALAGASFTKPEAVINGLIFEGETVLIAGRPKVGKSRLVQQMALAVTRGTTFLGMAIPRERCVLMVDLENRPWAIRERLIRMAGGFGDGSGLFVWCANSLSADTLNATSAGVQKLALLVEQTGADLLIIDPWRLWLGKDENNAEEVVRGLRVLSSLRQSRPNLTIIIVHHVRKERFETARNLLVDPYLWADAVSGHHSLSSHVDGVLGLERQRDGDGEERIAFGGIARNIEPTTMLLEDNTETLGFEVLHSDAALDLVLTNVERDFWKIAVKRRRFTYTELVREAKTTNKKTVTTMLRKAEAQGLLRHDGATYEVVRSDTERN